MQLVIDLPEEVYKRAKGGDLTNVDSMMICGAVTEGTPLPKGHGDLIDVKRKITVPVYDEQYEEWGEKVLTVLEALNRWSDEGVTAKDVVSGQACGIGYCKQLDCNIGFTARGKWMEDSDNFLLPKDFWDAS